ncbi:hypothetical protein MBLNU230_g2612t1 [Neophaeotheca triangularis]
MLSHTSRTAVLLGALLATGNASNNSTANRPYPPADSYLQTTDFLDHPSYLDGIDDQQWYLDNIPFIDIPDQLMQDVYYYRTSVVKRHQNWIHEGHGWMMSEFIQPVGWAAKYQSVPVSISHHILETRWLRDTNVAKNMIELYARGGVEPLTGITYTHFVHRAAQEHAYVTGDARFFADQMEGLINIYNLWNTTRDNETGLYHRNPLQDAQEYSLPGFMVGGPGGGPVQQWNDFGLSAEEGGGNDYDVILLGPETYRPNFNAYMVSGARAIAEAASLNGNDSLAETWHAYAGDLESRMEDQLYSQDLNFWIDRVWDINLPIEDYQLIGFYPYRLGIEHSESMIRGLEASLTPEIFLAEFGPTTLSQSNPYFWGEDKQTSWCCAWNGMSWPYSTSLYLSTLAGIARSGASDVMTQEFFNTEMHRYARVNTRGGVAFTAESHYPSIDDWSGDRVNNSENYFHSTYMDNIFSDLFGIIPTLNDTLIMEPLVPENWTHFAVENLPYHGSLLSFFWDINGSHYKTGHSGLSIYSNGSLFHHQHQLGPVRCQLPFRSAEAAAHLAAQPQWQNILANPNSPWNLPSVTANHCLNQNGDECTQPAWKMNDGKLWYDSTPDNRWTNNQSAIPYATINITLPRPRKMTSISLAIYEDATRDPNGAIKCPAGLSITTGEGERIAYRRNWTDCVPNALNTIPFVRPVPLNSTDNETTYAQVPGGYEVETDFLQLIVSDQDRYSSALSEIQIWVPPNMGPRWEAEDGLKGIFIGGFNGVQSGLNASVVDDGVELTQNGWVEWAGVRRSDNGSGLTEVTVLGGGTGVVNVMANYIGEGRNVTFEGEGSERTLELDFLNGANVVTVTQLEGEPWVDALVVDS